jgi:alkylresorcinol/alkylpyrone synthase
MANQALPFAHAPERVLVPESAPRIAAVELALPRHRYGQRDLFATLSKRWKGQHRNLARLASLHDAVGVEGRHTALPLEEYERLDSFGKANDAFIRVGTELGAEAVTRALASAGLVTRDVGAIVFTTVTGLAVPTIDARLVNVLGLPRHIRRIPLFGLGCLGGAAGLARTADWLRAYPEEIAVLLSVELCSLTLQDDFSMANLVASGLFGDGAAAVVMCGADAHVAANDAAPASVRSSSRPRVIASKSAFFPNTERVMGWDIGETGFKVVLCADVPKIVHAHLPDEIDAFLEEHGLARGDIQHWVSHPGGPKVITAIEESLGLRNGALDITRRSLAQVGNLSSASVLHVLAETTPRARPGDLGVLLAMGPGFCAEMVLLAW